MEQAHTPELGRSVLRGSGWVLPGRIKKNSVKKVWQVRELAQGPEIKWSTTQGP